VRVHPISLFRPFALILVFALPVRGAESKTDFGALRAQVLALGELTAPPASAPAEGFAAEGRLRPIFFESVSWRGRPTRVFAWIGVPETAAGAKLPGVVLVHGGGGTAFKEWVAKWNERGFAAISIATEGQTDRRAEGAAKGGAQWMRHDAGGPSRDGIYADSGEPLGDQFMYHAVAATIRAHSLLRSLPEVDAAKVGVSGISWGGVITSTVIGIDPRFAFAVPIYGCGHLADAENQWGRALGANALYREVWDPMVRIGRAALPVLWLSWPGDQHFPLDCQAETYRAAPGPRMVSLIPGMRHSHPAGWNPPDGYAFAESIVRDGRPWCVQSGHSREGARVSVFFTATRPLETATLVATTDRGFTGGRNWNETPAVLTREGDRWRVDATLPEGATAWSVNARAGSLTASSDFQQVP
jgi:dienelactone hydrolase